jgi:hypothetical protein
MVLLFKIIALYINALCPPVLQLVSPFNIELSILVLKELIDRLHDTFIASKTSTTKLGFQFRKEIEVRRGQVQRIWGMEKNFKATVSCSSHRIFGCVPIAVPEKNALSQFAPPFTRDFLVQASKFVCIVRTVFGTTLLKIINHDYPLTISK